LAHARQDGPDFAETQRAYFPFSGSESFFFKNTCLAGYIVATQFMFVCARSSDGSFTNNHHLCAIQVRKLLLVLQDRPALSLFIACAEFFNQYM
jgi:hypothetical protein